VRRSLAIVMSGVAMLACSSPKGGGAADDLNAKAIPAAVTVESTVLRDQAPVPVRYTCDGDDVSPPLAWTGLPADTAEIAIVVDDPDAPRGTFVHWVVFHIDPAVAALDEAAVPAGARQAKNSSGDPAYDGPCPPGGSTHDYRFTVYALGSTIDEADGASADDAIAAIEDAAIARGRLTATYERQ